MAGLEDAVLRAAAAVVGHAARLLLADRTVKARRQYTDLVDLVTLHWTDKLTGRRVQRQLDGLVDEVYARLDHLRELEFARVPQAEQAAAVAEAADVWVDADLSDRALFDADLDPRVLARQIRAGLPRTVAGSGLGADATALYDRVVDECCVCLVRIVLELREFAPRALVEVLARQGDVADRIRQVLQRLPNASLDAPAGTEQDEEFRYRYQEMIGRTLDELELFGVTLQHRPRVKLSVSYLNLQVSSDSADEWNDEVRRPDLTGAERAATALARWPRVLVRGQAGSGKTTLLRWLAVTAARSGFTGDMARWNGLVPVLVKLRSFADDDWLPRPGEFFRRLSHPVFDLMPPGWAHRQLQSGQVLLMVDGVDELAPYRRDDVRMWLRDLLEEYPNARVVVTSRPVAAAENWLDVEGFHAVSLLPMTPADVRIFVQQWHEAVRHLGSAPCAAEELTAFESGLLAQLEARPHLRALASSPLLCAMLCALNLDHDTQLPKDRNSLYESALALLLERRDSRRGIWTKSGPSLDIPTKIILLQDLAWLLTADDRSELDREDARRLIAKKIKAIPRLDCEADKALDYLLERSGVIRAPAVGRVDFVHRTFQEFLAARQVAEEDLIGLLASHAHQDTWREVVLMTPGHANAKQRKRLLTRLLDRADVEPQHANRLRLLAGIALDTAQTVPAALQDRVEVGLRTLIPPQDDDTATQLAAAGERVLDLLPRQLSGLSRNESEACVRTAALIGGPRALRLLAGYAHRYSGSEIVLCWEYFEPVQYARQVLAQLPPGSLVMVTRPDHLPHVREISGLEALIILLSPGIDLADLGVLPTLSSLDLDGDVAVDFARLAEQPLLRDLSLNGTVLTRGLAALGALLDRLERLTVVDCPTVHDLAPLAGSLIQGLTIRNCPVRDLSPLFELPALQWVSLSQLPGEVDVAPLRERGIKVQVG